MRRLSPAMLIALSTLAAIGGATTPGESLSGMDAVRGSGALADPAAPTRTAKTSSIAKLRNLNFFRGSGLRKHHYTGVSMSVAEGKRRARKVRNRQRHKKQWKKAVR